MPQGVLSYKYEEEKTGSGMTALAGLPLYLDLMSALDIGASIRKHLRVKARGWTDEQMLLPMVFPRPRSPASALARLLSPALMITVFCYHRLIKPSVADYYQKRQAQTIQITNDAIK
jgi:hypothetical protein